MNEDIFQQIYEELADFFPIDWDKIIIYLEYGKNSYSFSFYVKEDDEYIKCYDLPDLNENELLKAYKKIDSIICDERELDNMMWTNMTIIISPDGEFSADYDYTDLSENSYEFKKNWKKKYLI